MSVLQQENLCAVLHAAQDLRIENRPILGGSSSPDDMTETGVVPPGHALVKIVITGICGSDLSSYLKGAVGGASLQGPMVLGHENAGIVCQLPPGLEALPGSGVKVGDRVAVKPGLPCLSCSQCRQGKQNQCRYEKYCAHPPTDGAMCQYFLAREDMLLRLPANLSWRAAGALQPLAIAVQVARRAQLRPHATVAILGAGPIGQLCLSMAHAYSARKTLIVDIDRQRTEFALHGRKKGRADFAVESRAIPDTWNELPGDLKLEQASRHASKWIQQAGLEDEGGFDIVIEASGAEAACMQGMELCKIGGTYCQVGLGAQVVHFNLLKLAMKEINAVGVLRYNLGCFEDALDFLERGVVDLDELVTDEFNLADAEKAFMAVRDRRGIKNVVWSFGPQ